MPELPEVETTRRILEPHLLGQKIGRIKHQDPHKYRRTDLAQGRTVVSAGRRGKFLIFGLDKNLELIVHLGMTGGFRFEPASHLRVTLELPKQRLYFTDARRFGKWWVVDAGDYSGLPLLAKMGPEPLSSDFTPEKLQGSLAKTRRTIKDILLMQEAVAGVGNIYVDESLWQARIHPLRRARSLKPGEIARLHHAIRDVIGRALEKGGSTLSDNSYQQPSGEPGYFQHEHQVYQRKGLPCLRCGTPIERIAVGQRGSHFCPRCQVNK